MARVRPQETAFRPGKNTARVERKSYLSWLHDLPCVICLDPYVDAAHLSKAKPEYGHLGRGKGRKVSDRWALPLCRDCHTKQHDVGEGKFWEKHDPWLLCLIIFGLWSDYGEEAQDRVTEIIKDGWW